jgi:hypothetical protein
MTLQEIGDKYGVTREAVRQMEARLIGRIGSAVIGSLEPKPTDPAAFGDGDSDGQGNLGE